MKNSEREPSVIPALSACHFHPASPFRYPFVSAIENAKPRISGLTTVRRLNRELLSISVLEGYRKFMRSFFSYRSSSMGYFLSHLPLSAPISRRNTLQKETDIRAMGKAAMASVVAGTMFELMSTPLILHTVEYCKC